MAKKYKDTFDQITHPDNIWDAYRKASIGKRRSLGYLLFKQDEGAQIAWLRDDMLAGTYTPGVPRTFMVYEPKPREITAMPFRDRVAQHALCNVIEPIFDSVFLPQSYACRKGMGTHRAAIAVQSMLRRALRNDAEPWVLKTDFSRYFASIDRAILHKEYRRKLSCNRTLALLSRMVPEDGKGLPIGSLTSQLSANIYGHVIDRWLVHRVGLSNFARYMDDVVVVGHSREAMALLQVHMQSFALSALGLKFSHWSVQPWQRGVNFCGYRIWPTHKLLRRASVTRAKQRLRALPAGSQDRTRFLAAWRGHAQWADSHNLLKHLGVNA